MEEITRFEIDMLDVGAADAFLLHAYRKYQDSELEYVVLIDAGNEGDGKKVMRHIKDYYQQQFLFFYNHAVDYYLFFHLIKVDY